MNYYPTNFYSNYPNYGQSNQTQMQYPYTTGLTPSTQQQILQQSMQNNAGFPGKIVDSEDIVKVTDVPMGGYGIFPKADFSEIYIKSWNNNGTTNIATYKPIVKIKKKEEEDDINNILLNKINKLEEKIDTILMPISKKDIPIVKEQEKKETLLRKEF